MDITFNPGHGISPGICLRNCGARSRKACKECVLFSEFTEKRKQPYKERVNHTSRVIGSRRSTEQGGNNEL